VRNDLDVPSRWLSVNEVIAAVPGVRPDGLVGAAFCPTDGQLDPHALVTTMAAEARANGAVIVSGAAVTGFRHVRGRVTAVELSMAQTITAGTVITCAGAWADDVAGLYGASLPITPWRSQLYLIEGATGVPGDSPFTIDFDNGKTFYHSEGRTSVIAGTDAANVCETSWHVPFDPAKTELLVERLTSRFKNFDQASVRHGWAGLLEITADENPISDWTHFANMYTMAGFSGHGLAIAPGLAEQVAGLLTDGMTSVDLAPYRADRFDSPSPPDSMEAMSMR
jgi:sarcosine oxidase subunit beta